MDARWPIRPRPRPDEILSSWLWRIAAEHRLKPHSFCHQVWPGRQIWNRDIDGFSDAAVVQVLARQTGIPLARAHETTLAAYEGWLFEQHLPRGKTKWVMRAGVYHRVRVDFGQQYCSQCLAERPYFRRPWRLALATACPRHRAVLRDRCPDCGAPIVLHRASAPWRCFRCGGDITAVDPAPVTDATALQFEHGAFRILARGAVRLAEYGPLRSHLYFDIVHQVLRVLATGPRAAALREWTARRWGGDPSPPTFPLEARELEMLPPGDRHALMGLGARLMEGYPFRLVAACSETRVFKSWVLRDLDPAPFALSDPVGAYLYRKPYIPNRAEVAAARAYLIRRGERPSLRALRRLLGADSIAYLADASSGPLRERDR